MKKENRVFRLLKRKNVISTVILMEKKEVKKKIRTKMKWICLFVVISSSLVSWGQQRKTLLMNGFLHVGNGETIPTAAIGMEGDKIVLVKNSLTYSAKKSDWDT